MSSSTLWFVIAAVAVLVGGGLLFLDGKARTGGPADARRKWADLRGWEFLESDPVLPSRWRSGPFRHGGPGVARNLISGEVPTSLGSRQGYVFDHEQDGEPNGVLAAVEVQSQVPAAVELWLPSAKLPSGMVSGDAGLDLLEEPVGRRHVFAADADAVRPLLTPRLGEATDAVGDDIDLIWAEESWVLATAPLDATPERLQDLLADLAEVGLCLETGQNATAHREF